jgi:hypothetical protein
MLCPMYAQVRVLVLNAPSCRAQVLRLQGKNSEALECLNEAIRLCTQPKLNNISIARQVSHTALEGCYCFDNVVVCLGVHPKSTDESYTKR